MKPLIMGPPIEIIVDDTLILYDIYLHCDIMLFKVEQIGVALFPYKTNQTELTNLSKSSFS